MSEEELIETLRAFEKNRVEQLEEPARNLFYAIMKIAGERDRLNNIIKETIEYIENMPYLQEVDEEFENVDGEVYFTYKEWDDTELLDILKGSDK